MSCFKGKSSNFMNKFISKMKLTQLTIFWCLILFLFSVAQSQPLTKYVVSANSFGSVKIGMTISQASKVLSIRLVREDGYEGNCYYVKPIRGFKGIGFMMSGKRIARIDIDSQQYTTANGARLGSSEAQIKRLYKGQIKISQHSHVDSGHYLIVTPTNSTHKIIFETDGKKVTTFRVGKYPEVGFIEGCS